MLTNPFQVMPDQILKPALQFSSTNNMALDPTVTVSFVANNMINKGEMIIVKLPKDEVIVADNFYGLMCTGYKIDSCKIGQESNDYLSIFVNVRIGFFSEEPVEIQIKGALAYNKRSLGPFINPVIIETTFSNKTMERG